jgi:site-specific DNA recombinase
VVKRAAVYVRRSNDPDNTRASVERQAEWCRDLAKREGLTVAVTLEDNDTTAADAAYRPGFERLLTLLPDVAVVVAYSVDRLYRSASDQERLFRTAEHHQVRLLTDGWIDPASDSAWLSGGLGAVVAGHEVRRVRRRVRDAMIANASAGRPHGRVAYGWSRRWTTDARGVRHLLDEVLDHGQAEVVKSSTRRLLAGESLHSVAAGLQARGVPAPDSAAWSSRKLRAVVLRDRNAGVRVHHGERVADGLWPAIISEGDLVRLKSLLADPADRPALGPRRRFLLSGIAFCSVCETRVRGAAARGRYVARYNCGTGHVSRTMTAVDDLVTRVIVARLAMPDLAEVLVPDDSADRALGEQIAVLRARRDAAADAYTAGALDIATVTRITAGFTRDVASLEQRRNRAAGRPAALSMAGPDAGSAWAAASLDVRRAAIGELMRISILPTIRGQRTFDATRIRIDWV